MEYVCELGLCVSAPAHTGLGIGDSGEIEFPLIVHSRGDADDPTSSAMRSSNSCVKRKGPRWLVANVSSNPSTDIRCHVETIPALLMSKAIRSNSPLTVRAPHGPSATMRDRSGRPARWRGHLAENGLPLEHRRIVVAT